jgi:hypothetical protein
MVLPEIRFPLLGTVRMEGVMAYRSSRLPNRFPVGTKFVIEGQPCGEGQVQVLKRYLEFPDGTFFRLPAKPRTRPGKRKSAAAARRRARGH